MYFHQHLKREKLKLELFEWDTSSREIHDSWNHNARPCLSNNCPRILRNHTCARLREGQDYPPPLGQNFGFIPPLSKPRSRHLSPPWRAKRALAKSGLSGPRWPKFPVYPPPLKSQVQTIIPPLSNPSLHTYAYGSSHFIVSNTDKTYFVDTYNNRFLVLDCNNLDLASCSWTEMEQKLKYPSRNRPIVTLIPDRLTNCT